MRALPFCSLVNAVSRLNESHGVALQDDGVALQGESSMQHKMCSAASLPSSEASEAGTVQGVRAGAAANGPRQAAADHQAARWRRGRHHTLERVNTHRLIPCA